MTVGIKETTELLVAVNKITLFLIKRLKDGAGLDDAMAIYAKLTTDEEFKKVVFDAYDGVKAIPSEIKDLDYREVVQLLLAQINFIPLIIDEIKKP